MTDADDTGTHEGYAAPETEPGRRRWPIVALLALILLLVGGAFGAYAYDNSKKDQIADGITAAGVDIGGLTGPEATALLQRKLIKPLRGPVRVTFDGDQWTLAGKKLGVRADIDGMVEQALADSREGSFPGRLVREIGGGEVDKHISSEVHYSQAAINRFVRHVASKINRDPVDASVSPSADSLNVVTGKPGRKVRDVQLTRKLNAAVKQRGKDRTVVAVVHSTKPEITTNEVAQKYPAYITVDQATFTARLWKSLKLVKSYPIAVGQPAYPTPYGLFSIQDKQVDPVWSVPNSPWAGELAGTVVEGGTEANPLKARWMGVTNGVGFHGTSEDSSVGTAASHGCMRMHVSDVIDLYDRTPVGTPVYIG